MKLKVGLIGAGAMGLHLAKMGHELETAQIVAICDENIEAAKKAGEALGVPYFQTHQEMFQNVPLQAVLIATPNHTHASLAIESAQAKKHIFVEKPMALSVEDCKRMIKAARENKVKLMVGQVLRFIPTFAKVKEIVDSGLLGKPMAIFTTRISDW